MPKLIPTPKIALAACLSLGLGLAASIAHADFLPELPIEEMSEEGEDDWLCDVDELEIYLPGDGVYYVDPNTGSLVPLRPGQELILGFETRTSTSIEVRIPSNFAIGYSVDGSAPTIMTSRTSFQGNITNDLSTHEFAPLPPTESQTIDLPNLPSKGKITIQSHDDCPDKDPGH